MSITQVASTAPPTDGQRRVSTSVVGRSVANILLPAAGILLAAAIWQLLSSFSLFSTGLPSFTDSFGRATHLLSRSAFWGEIGTTLTTAAVGLVLTVAITIPLGLVIALSRRSQQIISTFVEILRPIPPLVYLPIAVLALGATTRTELVLVLSGSLWPMLIQVVYGVRSVDTQRIDVATVYGLTLGQRLRYVILPGATPYIMTGLRLTATFCLIIAVTAEMLGTKAGLGGDLAQSQVTGDNTQLFALVLVVGTIGVLVDLLGRVLEGHLLRWQPSRREV